MVKGHLWDKRDLELVLRLFKQHTKQKEINRLLISDRKSRNVWEGEKDLSNRISRLSPNSKHRIKEERTIRSRVGYKDVVLRIMKCLRVNETIASRKYTDHIYLSGIAPYDFFDPNNRNLVSIRYEAPTDCKAHLYFAFTSEDYDIGLDDEATEKDIWTVKTPFTYTDVITGRLSLDRITVWLDKMADDYQPIFVNTLIYKRDD